MQFMNPTNNRASVKYSFTTHNVPLEEMSGFVPLSRAPSVGDLVLAEVLTIGRHKTIENRSGAIMYLFPGDLLVGAFGNRYATDQYEGYVPEIPVEECDLLSVGGVFGEVASQHATMSDPTRLRVLGLVSDESNAPINQRDFALPPAVNGGSGEVIVVVGSAMNSGKTTTAGTVIRSLSRAGYDVAAAKLTGTACSKDLRLFESCGAHPALDFTSAGYPSTYMLGLEGLLSTYHALLTNLRASDPDYVVIEVADGIFQRETRMLLESRSFRNSIDHLFFAAGDSLGMESGVRVLEQYGLPLRATSGAVTQSELMVREAEAVTGMPCLSMDRIMSGELLTLLGAELAQPYVGVGA